MRRHLVPLFAANIVAFASVGLSYLIYSRLLSATEFGAYAAALAIGNLAILILDGGIKTSIIKHPTDLERVEESALLSVMLGFSAVLLLAVYFGQDMLRHFYPAASDQTVFVSAFAAIYLVTYPWIGLSTASLERNLSYSRLAWIESIGIVLERATPAFFLLAGLGLKSFVFGLALGRVARIFLLAKLHYVRPGWRFKGTSQQILGLMREGLMFQLGGAASVIRDNLHVIVVGPLYGALWVGYYAWGFQLCSIASQAFVQISARVSLSVTAKATDFSARWETIKQQIALLTTATAPILVVVIVIAPMLDQYLFDSKWRAAIGLLPLLCARMLPGIACTPVGTLVLVEKGAATYAKVLWFWTATELAAAAVAVLTIGSTGLAVSYSVSAWVGIFLLLRAFRTGSTSLFKQVCVVIIQRPGVWVSIAVAATYLGWVSIFGQQFRSLLTSACLIALLCAYFADPNFRSIIKKGQK